MPPDGDGACGLFAGPRGVLVTALCDGIKVAMASGGWMEVAHEALWRLLEGASNPNSVIALDSARLPSSDPG